MISLISWVITGLIVGLIARAVVPGRQSLGLLMTIVLGIVGAFVGGLISTLIWGNAWANNVDDVGTAWPGWIMSLIGAVVVLWGYLALTNRRDVTTTRY